MLLVYFITKETEAQKESVTHVTQLVKWQKL